MRASRRFDARAFVAVTVALCGIGLATTGVANHVLGFSPLTVERHAWMSAHNGLALMFLAFSVWHVVLNRRSLWKHVRRSSARVPRARREAVLAGLAVVLSLLLLVGHAIVAQG